MAKSAFFVFIAAAILVACTSSAEAQQSLITISNGQFVDGSCKPFYFSGYNTWQILETAGGVCCGGKASVEQQFDTAQNNSLTVVRAFAYGVSDNYQLQEVPGQYNESAFQDLDYVIAEAGKRNLRLILSLASNWMYGSNTTGTKCWYTNFTTTAANCDQFFTDPNAIQLYKDWVKTITTRKNTVTNVTYGSDPTIFAWDLINEGRCDDPNTCTAANIQSWIENVAPYLKSNVQQLTTVGEDGFLQASNCLSDKINPVTNNIGWPLQTGQDFVPNHAANGIDYASIHLWPDNWARVDTTFGMNWLTGHANLSSEVLNKPLVVEEFGKAYGGGTQQSGQGQTEAEQTDYYKLVYSIVENSIDSGGVIKGIAFWRWDAAISPTAGLAPFDDAATISSTGPTFTQVIEPFSQRVSALTASGAVQGCTPSSSAATSPGSSVNGRRLMQSSAGPSGDAANANSLVPASLCGAYPPQPSNVG